MTRPPPTIVTLRPGTILSDEAREDLLTRAIKTHFHSRFSSMRPDDVEKVARALAKDLLLRSYECNMQHLQADLGRRIELSPPSAEECESLDELVGEIIEFRYSDKPRRESKAYRAVKYTSGVIWKNLRRALGLPESPPEEKLPSAAGPRG